MSSAWSWRKRRRGKERATDLVDAIGFFALRARDGTRFDLSLLLRSYPDEEALLVSDERAVTEEKREERRGELASLISSSFHALIPRYLQLTKDEPRLSQPSQRRSRPPSRPSSSGSEKEGERKGREGGQLRAQLLSFKLLHRRVPPGLPNFAQLREGMQGFPTASRFHRKLKKERKESSPCPLRPPP